MSDAQQPIEFVDRKGILTGMGAVLIILGLFALLGAVASLLGPIMSAVLSATGAAPAAMPMTVPLRAVVPGLVMGMAKAAVLIALGIGSILSKRWARALTLAYFGWYLFIGLVTVVAFPATIRFTQQIFGQIGEMVPDAGGTGLSLVMFFAMGFALLQAIVFQVALPLLYILVYRTDNVRYTCEYRNPAPSWTDACPAPLLVLSFAFAMGGAVVAASALALPLLPTPWGLLTGPPALLPMLAIAVVSLLLAWGFYRRSHAAWWGCLALMILYAIAAVPTLRRVDFREILAAMDLPEQMLSMFSGITAGTLMPFLIPAVLGGIGLLAYLIYVRRFLRTHKGDGPNPNAA